MKDLALVVNSGSCHLVEFLWVKNELFKGQLPDLDKDLFEDKNGGYSDEKYVKNRLTSFSDIVIFLFCQLSDPTASYFTSLKRRF